MSLTDLRPWKDQVLKEGAAISRNPSTGHPLEIPCILAHVLYQDAPARPRATEQTHGQAVGCAQVSSSQSFGQSWCSYWPQAFSVCRALCLNLSFQCHNPTVSGEHSLVPSACVSSWMGWPTSFLSLASHCAF